MAFTIKQIKATLSDAGLPADKLESTAEDICGRHSAEMDAIKEERDSYKADALKLPGVQAELEKLKSAADDGFKQKYEDEHAAFEKFKADTAAEKALVAKKAAYRDVLKDAGITEEKYVEKVLKYTSYDGMELDDNGKLKDSAKLLKSAKEEWPEYITTEGKKGASTGNPPANSGGGKFKSVEEIYAIKDTAERQKAMLDNHELFGF